MSSEGPIPLHAPDLEPIAGVGFWKDASELSGPESGATRFEPQMGAVERDALYAGWQRAVERSRG